MDENERLEEFKRVIAQPTGQPGTTHRVCLCEKVVPEAENTRHYHSGVVNFTECLCVDCRKELHSFTRVVCLKCKALMSLLKPQKAATGYEFKPRSCVHVESCQTCEPSRTAFPVLEHLRFCRDQGRPTNVDQDIVQEAEQKALQAVKDADKMRAELTTTFPAP